MSDSKKPKATKQANQYSPDPRQTLFLEYYLDPSSETFSNGYRSALKAGYSEEYAQTITANKSINWLSESVSDEYKLKIAEDNLVEFLTMMTNNRGSNKNGEAYIFEDAALKRIKADMTKFVLERLNKKKYAQRNELTGKDGKDFVDVTDPKTMTTLLKSAQAILSHVPAIDTAPSVKK